MNTYVIHLDHRDDRLKFYTDLVQKGVDFKIFRAFYNKDKPFMGLIESVRAIIRTEYYNESVLIMEDDIMLESKYSFRYFTEIISCIYKKNPDVSFILGGASFVRPYSAEEGIKDPYFQIREFSGTHCIVLFKAVYDWILDHDFKDNYDAELSIELGSERIKAFGVYPFVARAGNSFSDIRRAEVNDKNYFDKYQYI